MFIPKNLLSASAQLTGSAATYYTSLNTKTIVTKCTITNNDTVVRTFTIYVIKSGGTAGVTNVVILARSIAPSETQEVPEMSGQILEDGDFIQMLASTTAVLTPTLAGIQTGRA